MSNYDNTNRGALFKNEDKSEDTDTDYNGSINVGGQEYWLNAWIKKSKAGKTYMSLSVKPKQRQSAPPTGGRNDPRPPREDYSDPIPF